MEYRICILGNPGSGKTTLAKALAKKFSLPIFHLDRELLIGDFESLPLEERSRKHQELIKNKSWIIDGNYRKSDFAERIKRANLVIFLNISRIKTVPRVILRTLFEGQDHKAIPIGARPHRLSWDFLKYILTCNRKKYLLELKETCRAENTKLLILKNQTPNQMISEVAKRLSEIRDKLL